MAKVYTKYNFTGVSSPFIIAVIVEHALPLAEVARKVLTAPYEGAITFDNLNPVMHRVSFYQSANGTTLGSLLISASIDATIYNVPKVEFITFQPGLSRGAPYYDPGVGTNSYTNPSLAGYTKNLEAVEKWFTVHREGLGIVSPDNINDIINGFKFNNDSVWVENERVIVTKYLTVSETPVNVVQRPWANIIDVSADFTFSSTYYNNFIRADWAGSIGTITFPAHAGIPNYTRVKISAHGGNQNYIKLQFNGAETVKFYNANKNVLYLEKGSEIELSWNQGACFVTDYKGNYLLRGKVIPSYDNTSGRPFLYCHADTGVLNKTDYPALYEYIESLPVGVAVDLANWNNTEVVAERTIYVNRRRFGIDTILKQFRVPDLSDTMPRFLKASGVTDTERKNDIPGGYQIDGFRVSGQSSIADTSENISSGNEIGGLKVIGSFTYASGDNSANEPSLVTLKRLSPVRVTSTRPDNYGQIPIIYL